MKKTTLLACLFVSVHSFLFSNPNGNNQDDYKINITKTKEPIVIDGNLQEAIWQESDVASNFWMSFPVDDQRAERKTEVRMTYDENFLYIAATCYGSENYIIQTLKRDADFWQGDGFAFVIDPVNERTNGFLFGTNPAGVQMESLITGYTGNRGGRPRGMNSNWDHKWYAEVQLYEDRWTAEIAIPFKTLRYESDKTQWGINFIRSDMEDNSYHTWSPVPVQFRAVDLGYTGALLWDNAPKKQKGNIALIPYATGGANQDLEVGKEVKFTGDVGGDAKVSISSSLNLDLTVNPDFSQIEVDEQVTNLTRFSIRLPEKRTFFLENSDIFEDFGRGLSRPFFSRRIGLDEDGNAVPITFGMRLSGNLNENWRTGLLNIQTQSNDTLLGQNYTAIAIHRKVLQRSNIKAYFLNRQSTGGTAENPLDDYGRNAGLEFTFFSKDSKSRAWLGYGNSIKANLNDKNHFMKAGYNYQGKAFGFIHSMSTTGENYYIDMGFLQRVENYDAEKDTTIRLGFVNHTTFSSYRLFPKEQNKILYQTFSLRNFMNLSEDWSFNDRSTRIAYSLTFKARNELSVEWENFQVNLLYPFTFTDGTPLPVDTYHYSQVELEYRSDARKRFGYRFTVNYGSFYNGTRKSVRMGVKFRKQPWGNFGLNFSYNDLQFPEPYGEEQLFLFSSRLEIGFSRNLFWTTFLQWNTQSDNFNINSRFQWRFKPMSDLFIVYTDNYEVENFGRKSRALVFKLNYWFSL